MIEEVLRREMRKFLHQDLRERGVKGPLLVEGIIGKLLALIKPVKQCPFDEGGVCHVFDNDKEEG